MADGDVILDDDWTEDEVLGTRCAVEVVESSDHPPGYRYRFQLYQPDGGTLLRYDNFHERDDVGWHHRHVEGDVFRLDAPPSSLAEVERLLQRFLTEVDAYHD